jgi:hypothetical protein
VLNVGDVSVARAVDTLTAAALIVIEAENGMVEHVESIHAELDRHPFRSPEVLQERCVGIEDSRSAIAEDADVAEIAKSWVGERTPNASDDIGYRGKERHDVSYRIKGTRPGVEESSSLIGTTESYILL